VRPAAIPDVVRTLHRPTGELHLVMDNYATHKKVEVRDWLAAHPRITAHFTPTSGSWLNLVEVWGDHPAPSHPPRQPRLRQRPQHQDPCLRQRLERPLPPLRLDQDPRPDPQENQKLNNLRNGPLVSRLDLFPLAPGYEHRAIVTLRQTILEFDCHSIIGSRFQHCLHPSRRPLPESEKRREKEESGKH
jgi:DDE superfamily endonuclease